MTSYKFVLKAQFGVWPVLATGEAGFEHTTAEFWIKDYCAGMTISGTMTLTIGDSSGSIVEGLTPATSSGDTDLDPYVLRVTKHLMTEMDTFTMPCLNYLKFGESI